MADLRTAATVDARGRTTRDVNSHLRALIADGVDVIDVNHPDARHNLGVGLTGEATISYKGPVGYFCGALSRGQTVEIRGNAGWSTGADLMDGSIRVHGHAGASTGAAMRGGVVVVDGDAGSRTGIAMKGGLLIVGGSTGHMTGFQMQNGIVVVCGDAAHAFGDSMYRGTLFCGGKIASLGADTQVANPDDKELGWLRETLREYELDDSASWRKVTSAGRLWRFDKREFDAWKDAL